MVGSLAIIGLPDEPIGEKNPGKYLLGAQTPSAVTLTDQQTLLDSNIEQNETHTILTFTKLLVEPGEISINPNGDNFFIVAGGSRNNLDFHQVREAASLNLAPCTPQSGGSSVQAQSLSLDTKQKSFKAHGWLMALAWGLLA